MMIQIIQNFCHRAASGIFCENGLNIIFVIAKKHCPEHDQHGIQEGVAVFFMPEIFDIKIFQHITDADIIKSMENQIIPLSFTIKYVCKKMGKCAVGSQRLEKSGLKSRATDQDIKSETVVKNSDTVRGMRRYDADISGMEFMSHSLDCCMGSSVIYADNFKKLMLMIKYRCIPVML